jgi:hypothetical protein
MVLFEFNLSLNYICKHYSESASGTILRPEILLMCTIDTFVNS